MDLPDLKLDGPSMVLLAREAVAAVLEGSLLHSGAYDSTDSKLSILSHEDRLILHVS